MTNLLEDCFFTPPNLPPLGLDLVDLQGGGTAPAQYHGTTSDGRKVYCRYRGGFLSVTIGNNPGSDVFKDGTIVLDERVGPPLHGTLSLGQFCEISGITLNGALPALPTPVEQAQVPTLDLSGDTTFFDLRLNSTATTARLALQRICETLPDGVIIERVLTEKHQICGGNIRQNVQDISSMCPTIMFGAVPKDAELDRLSQAVQLQDLYPNSYFLEVAYNGFRWPTRKFDSLWTDRMAQETDREVYVAGATESCLYKTLSFNAQFPTSDRDMRRKSERIRDCLASIFPTQRIECIDLKTNQHLMEFDRTDRVDHKIIDWINSAPDRFLHVSTVPTDTGRKGVGFKPRPLE